MRDDAIRILVDCPLCDPEDPDPDCEVCGGFGVVEVDEDEGAAEAQKVKGV